MKNKFQYFLAVVISVVIFDVIASFTSKILEFEYTSLAWISLCLYFLAGLFGSKRFDFATGLIAGVIAGFADSTLGWAISSVIKPYISFEQIPYTLPLIVEIITTVSLTGAVFGLIGSFVGYIIRRK